MKLTFRLRFHSRFGQSLFLVGEHEIFGGGDPAEAIPLEYAGEGFWQVTVVVPRSCLPGHPISYEYLLREPDGSCVQDWGRNRTLDLASLPQAEVLVVDSWNHPGFIQNVFSTDPFRQILLRGRHHAYPVEPPSRFTHMFRVKAPLLTSTQTLCLLGEGDALGNWLARADHLLARTLDDDSLSIRLDLSAAAFPIFYKYGVYDLERRELVRFEDGANRVLSDTVADRKGTVVHDGFAQLPSTEWKGAGVAVPVFSLRSSQSGGVGEFADLRLLVDWCRGSGLKLIQILPVNDTTATHTWVDSYPYAAISAFALHPLYLNLGQVAEGKNKKILTAIEEERQRLNSLPAVDYEGVMRFKLEALKKLYSLQRAKTFRSEAYRSFFTRNEHWLVPYAAFCVLRDRFGTPDFSRWPSHSQYEAEAISAMAAPESADYEELGLHYFMQFHLHCQLQAAAEYAHAHGIILKGDIAIGVGRHGADTWQQPALYHMEMQAGAPPDAFAVKGQNWGFPTYNWPRMQEDGFAWWKARFAQMSCYFDAFRIDHILGFFRIWSVPLHAVEGILGYFVPALPVQPAEFTQRGLPFDRDRFCRPHITERILQETFADESEAVKCRFLVQDAEGGYSFKPEYATQRQVEAHFASLEASETNRKLKLGLFDLISNVILLEVDGRAGKEYHFRFSIETTSSYRDLDAQSQRQLSELYVDYFFRRQDSFWMRQALQKLPALKRVTNMLVCGEDLGLVPACVPEVMNGLGLLSLDIQRMPKKSGLEFFHPKDAPYLGVVTPSTHDMSTIRGWWEEDPAVTQRFFKSELGQQGQAPQRCPPWVNEAILQQHLASPAMWSIFQLQDLLGMDETLRRANPAEERINVPAIPNYYWRYRMHLDLETLLQATGFSGRLKRMVEESSR